MLFPENKNDARATENCTSDNSPQKKPSDFTDSCQLARCSSNLRTHDGWKFKWTEPQKNFISAVIRGPFYHPRLVKPLPYIVISSCDDCGYKNHPACRLRNGIPDPWQEYISWKDSGVPGNEEIGLNDVRLSRDYLRYTDYAWNKKGLAMVQGIPDPWKIDMFCECGKTERQNVRRKKRKKSEVHEIMKGEMKEITDAIRNSINADKTKDNLEKVSRKAMEKLEEPSKHGKVKQKLTENLKGYEKIKQKLREFDDELKLNQAENEKRKRDAKKREKRQRAYKKSNHPEIICCTSHLLQPAAYVTKKPSTSKKCIKGPIKDYVDRKIRADISAYVREEFERLREADKSRRRSRQLGSADRSSAGCLPCAGSCGRSLRRKDSDDVKVTRCGCSDDNDEDTLELSQTRTEDLRKFLNEINSRIEITKDAMKSTDLEAVDGEVSRKDEKKMKKKKAKEKESNDSSKKSSSGKREKGAGDKVLVIRHEEDLFVRRKYCDHSESSESQLSKGNDKQILKYVEKTVDCEVLQIPGANEANELLKCSYRKSLAQNGNGVDNKNDEEIMVQSFTETE